MIINTEEFRKGLDMVKPGVAAKEDVIEQATHFAFVDSKIVSYNDELCISHKIDGLDITGAVQAEELYKLISKIKTKEIDITEGDNEIVFKSGKSRTGFAFTKEIKLPLQDEVTEIGKWKSLPVNFNEAIKFVSESCSNDILNPKTACVHINEKGFVEGTDTHKLSHWKFESPLAETILIPAKNVSVIVKVAPTKMAKGNGWIHFKNKDTVISCRAYNEQFMDTAKVLAKPESKGLAINFPDELVDALDKAKIFISSETKDKTVAVSITNNKLTVSNQSEIGWYRETFPIQFKGTPFSFAIEPQTLISILKYMKTCMFYSDRLRFEGDNWIHVTLIMILTE